MEHGHESDHDHCSCPYAAAVAECANFCFSCAAHCAKKVSEGDVAHYETSQTCTDCGTICTAALQVFARSGPFKDIIGEAAAAACGQCAAACEKFPDDEHMAKCAAECRKCEKTLSEPAHAH